MRILFSLVVLICCASVWGQTDFDHYQPLSSSGPVPEDFLKPTSQKVREDYPKFTSLSRKEREYFVDEVNFGVDELLHTGEVHFGDPVSNYLTSIKDRLLANDSILRTELRIYVLDLPDVNAFSTAQGVIFVTSGLVAQSTSEAQVAFVLAHEIIHYVEKHSLNHYTYILKNKKFSYSEKVRFFSNYSRQNELEADMKGLRLFFKAGYDRAEIDKTFDVLRFAATPFEEIPVTTAYFDNRLQFVDPNLFRGEKHVLRDRSDYDDRYATHPNITKRVEALHDSIFKMGDWKGVRNYDEARFLEIRNICRFQYLLHQFGANNDVGALYAVMILEKDFPDSRFLREAKAQAWLGIIAPKPKEIVNDFLADFDLEEEEQKNFGELSLLEKGLDKLSKTGRIAMALRSLTDLRRADESDTLLTKMWEKGVKIAAYTSMFKLDNFSNQTFKEAADSLRLLYEKDSVKNDFGAYRNKYDVLKSQQRGMVSPYKIDTSRFYMYSLSDLKRDSVFLAEYDHYKYRRKAADSVENHFFLLNDEEQTKELKEKRQKKYRLEKPDSILLVRPQVGEFYEFSHPRIDFTEKKSTQFVEVLNEVASEMNVRLIPVGELTEKPDTEDFNDQQLLIAAIEQAVEYGSGKVVNRNYFLDLPTLNKLSEKYKARYALWPVLNHNYSKPLRPSLIVASILIPPFGLLYVPPALMNAHVTEIKLYVIDLKTGEVRIDHEAESQDPDGKKILKEKTTAVISAFKEQ